MLGKRVDPSSGSCALMVLPRNVLGCVRRDGTRLQHEYGTGQLSVVRCSCRALSGLGFPELTGLFRGPHWKGAGILGSVLGSSDFRKLGFPPS